MGADTKLREELNRTKLSKNKKEFTCSKCGKRSATIVEMCHAFRRLRELDNTRIVELEELVKKLRKKVKKLKQKFERGNEEWDHLEN